MLYWTSRWKVSNSPEDSHRLSELPVTGKTSVRITSCLGILQFLEGELKVSKMTMQASLCKRELAHTCKIPRLGITWLLCQIWQPCSKVTESGMLAGCSEYRHRAESKLGKKLHFRRQKSAGAFWVAGLHLYELLPIVLWRVSKVKFEDFKWLAKNGQVCWEEGVYMQRLNELLGDIMLFSI